MSGGLKPFKRISTGDTNAALVQAGPTILSGGSFGNVSANARFVKFYDKASPPVVGTDTPVLTFIVPGNTSGAGSNVPTPFVPPAIGGFAFNEGIAIAITGGMADNDNTGIGAGEVCIAFGYR